MSTTLKLFLLTNYAAVIRNKVLPPESGYASILSAVVAAENEAGAVSRHPLAPKPVPEVGDDWPTEVDRINVLHLGDYTGPSDPNEPSGPLTLAVTLGTPVGDGALLRTDGPPERCPEVFDFGQREDG